MNSPAPRKPAFKKAPRAGWPERLFAAAAGAWLGLSLLKFGNPVILNRLVPAPTGLAELLFAPWPLGWGCALAALVGILGWPLARLRLERSHWPLALLAAWLFWQFASGSRTVDPPLTKLALTHFSFCGAAFAVGFFAFGRVGDRKGFYVPLIIGFLFVLYWGFDQHHGGLEATRRAFYEQPDWQNASKEFLLKIQSDRIFSTLVYPNALAGAILLFGPLLIFMQWQLSSQWPRIVRGVFAGLLIYLSLACLYWSGSKGGWLVAIVAGAVLLLQSPAPKKIKAALVISGVTIALAVFGIRFAGYFQKGATSVAARFDYWQAAVQTAKSKPLFGSGPGTFQIAYRDLKPPDAEMTRLTHNDYLEQASDSGFPGFLFYAGFIIASLAILRKRCAVAEHKLIWLGLLTWSLQGLIEFGLYIPALAWPAFFFFGWLWSLEPAEPARSEQKVFTPRPSAPKSSPH